MDQKTTGSLKTLNFPLKNICIVDQCPKESKSTGYLCEDHNHIVIDTRNIIGKNMLRRVNFGVLDQSPHDQAMADNGSRGPRDSAVNRFPTGQTLNMVPIGSAVNRFPTGPILPDLTQFL